MAAVEWIHRGPTTAVLFEPDRFGIVADPLGAPNETRPLRAGDVFERWSAVQVAFNGPMFSRCSREPGQRAGEGAPQFYARLTCELADYAQRDRAAGLALPGSHPRDGVTLSVVPTLTGAVASGARGDAPAPDATVSAQRYPPLVVDGQLPTINTDDAIKWRGAMGLLADGRLCFVASQMGMQAFQRECRAIGCRWAGYGDGGGSLELAARDGTRVGAAEDRPVPTWLVVLAPSLPRTVERYAIAHPVATAAAVASVGVAGWVAYHGIRRAAHGSTKHGPAPHR
jgi:hypothetical protein